MTEAEWLACEEPMEILDALELEVHLRAKARIMRSWRLVRWFAPKASLTDDRRPFFTPRQLYLLACAVNRVFWKAHNGDALSSSLALEERFADGEITLAELLADDPERQWHWPNPPHLISNVFRRGRWPPAFEGTGRVYCNLTRDIFGNPFRPAAFSPAWRTSTVLALASQMYISRDFGAMPILADALQEGGCDNADVLNHCRDANAPHVRGCWVVDLVLGKE